jgi:hypothetical protein
LRRSLLLSLGDIQTPNVEIFFLTRDGVLDRRTIRPALLERGKVNQKRKTASQTIKQNGETK